MLEEDTYPVILQFFDVFTEIFNSFSSPKCIQLLFTLFYLETNLFT